MRNNKLNLQFAFIILFFLQISCSSINKINSDLIINTSHLDFLFEEIEVDGSSMGIIHIYSDAPEYKWTGDDDEGIACVDDAARAAVFYLNHYKYYHEKSSLNKAKKLLNFMMYMQSDNGYFYNFIWPDLTINKDFKTSVAEPNWWSWRAMWSLMNGYELFKDQDFEFSQKLLSSVQKTIDEVKKHIPEQYLNIEIDGFEKPTWLPFQTASDQSSVLLLALTSYYKINNDRQIFDYCKKIAEGIIIMQEGDSTSFPYGAFLSWENQWHGWGNLQAYALLKFYQVSNYLPAKNSALKEINNFYDYLIDQNYFEEFKIESKDGKIIPTDVKKFPQIAYIMRPQIFSSLEAYKITGDSKYASQAGEIANWFFGNNIAKAVMYSIETGRGYDGIISENEVNKNSGAESTIEALLSLLEVENNPIAKKQLKISSEK